VAFAEIELPEPLNDWGVVKGLLLRHFRWWSSKHDMFNMDGTLTIGFTYPNMYMSEDYNSPQSPYWALKSFLALGLPDDHPFWTAEEKPPPRTGHAVVPIKSPMHILCSQSNHHFLLSMGQFCPWPLKATEAKYGKYAYSSHFGFSVPTGTLIQQIAPDSTLALSKDSGETWRVPWKVTNHCFATAQLIHNGELAENIHVLTSTWKPWADANITVQTDLIPPCSRWPDWYLRWHRITNTGSNTVKIHAVQGGFAIQGRGNKHGEVLPTYVHSSDLSFTPNHNTQPFPEGTVTTRGSTLVCSNAGASGISILGPHNDNDDGGDSLKGAHAEVLKPDANTNLMWQRTLIPVIRNELDIAPSTASRPSSQFGSAVFALARTVDREERYAGLDHSALWTDVPVLDTLIGKRGDGEWHIKLQGRTFIRQ
jgi:hypothetical protein